MSENQRLKWMCKAAPAMLVCYWIALVVSTHLPQPLPLVRQLNPYDKFLHFSAYAGLAFLLSWNGSLLRPANRRLAAIVLAVVALSGAIDEVTQIPFGRQCDLLDWIADMVGASTGVAVFFGVLTLAQRPIARRT